MNPFARKAKETALRDGLAAHLELVAEGRRRAREQGVRLPENIQEMIANLRQALRDAGLSEDEIQEMLEPEQP
ncbi:hypothetical protein [Mycobacterium malmoense]|uniref:hypothetical protein n=1 Tax=Mycobacterium malmoense TaxID=1780 RepID=UPI00112FE03C|nr:hypothetical protein [Mycobacterium malmoense]